MSDHEMALLPEGDPMNIDGAIPGMQGIQGMENMDGIEGMGDMEGMGNMGSMGGMGMTLDLFGDPVMDNALAGLPSRPVPSKHLQHRIDEMRTRGCCQGIAWSRHGTIASIAKDGMSVELRFIRCNPDTTEWELSEPSFWSPPAPPASPSAAPNPPTPASTTASASAPLVHLAWAPTMNPDIAVIDALGRITLLSFHITINQTYPVRRWETDVVDDLHAVVGCYWLPMGMAPNKQYYLTHGPATKHQSEYKYEHQLYPAFGPWHPHPGKSAFLCVTTNGALKLFFTQINGRLEETAIELESVTSSDDLITHASLCSDKNTLLIALATASNQLRIVRASIQWGLPQVDKQVPPGSVPLRPSLKESHVAVTSWVQYGANESPMDASMVQLSHIEVLPSAPAAQSQPMAPPVVLTVRSYIPQDSSSYHQESQSIIDRWEVVSDQAQSIHPAFEQLGAKNGATSTPPTMTRLRKLAPIILPKVVVTVTTAQFGRIICLAFSDGTVQYRDRFTMEDLYSEHNVNSITHPLQVGFQYLNDTPCLQVAFSPTNCSFAQLCEDSTVKWNRLHYPTEDPNIPLQAAELKTVLVALTLPLSATAMNQVTCDDILAMARPFAPRQDFASAWVKEMVNMLKIVVDYSEEAPNDPLLRNTLLQLCFSVLSHLSFHGDFRPRSPAGKFSMLALSLRNIFVVITVASNSPMGYKEKLNPLDDPEVVDAVTGCTKWGVSLLAWLTDSLFQLLNDPEIMAMLSDPKRFPDLAKYLQSKNDVSLQLLLCSSTRGFLSSACRRMIHVETVSSRAAQYHESQVQHQQQQQDTNAATSVSRPHPALYQAYQRMVRAVSSPLVKVSEFDRLLSELGSDIHTAYQRSFAGLNLSKVKPQHANMTEQQQQQYNEQFIKKALAHCELDMLLGRNPPPSFREVLLKFFSTTLPALRNQTDPAKLYFANYDLLEVEDNPKAIQTRKATGKYVDVFKRSMLAVGPRARQPNGVGNSVVNGSQNGVVPAKRTASGEEVRVANGQANAGPNVLYGTWTGIGNDNGPQWRRCVRCAAVMEDIWSGKPGYHFVLSQQRKCICGGSWGTMPRGS